MTHVAVIIQSGVLRGENMQNGFKGLPSAVDPAVLASRVYYRCVVMIMMIIIVFLRVVVSLKNDSDHLECRKAAHFDERYYSNLHSGGGNNVGLISINH